jgi:hypothetical protein
MPQIFPASSAVFGVSGSATFQSKSVSTKFDKKEAFDQNGETIGWAFYGKMAEHSIELLGTDATTYAMGAMNGATTPPTGIVKAVAGTVFVVDELTINFSNDDFAKSSIKVSEYLIED